MTRVTVSSKAESYYQSVYVCVHLYIQSHHIDCIDTVELTPLMWTPWGPGEVFCIKKCPHFRGKFIFLDIAKCP